MRSASLSLLDLLTLLSAALCIAAASGLLPAALVFVF